MGVGAVDDSYSPPDWLTEDFLQDVLREYFKDDTLQVRDLKAEPMPSGGYASEMHRACFQLTRNHKQIDFSVIIKVSTTRRLFLLISDEVNKLNLYFSFRYIYIYIYKYFYTNELCR